MTCDSCDGNVIVKTGQKYHYKMSGLDNVYLENITTEVCQGCNQVTPYIPRIGQLHKIIAANLVLKPSSLTGKEMRFLRKERLKKAKDWAVLLGVEPETLSKWENNEEKPPSKSMNNSIRLLYCRMFEEQEKQKFEGDVLKLLVDLVDTPQQPICIDVTKMLAQRKELDQQTDVVALEKKNSITTTEYFYIKPIVLKNVVQAQKDTESKTNTNKIFHSDEQAIANPIFGLFGSGTGITLPKQIGN